MQKISSNMLFVISYWHQTASKCLSLRAIIFDLDNKRFIWSRGMYSVFELDLKTDVKPEIYSQYAAEDSRLIWRLNQVQTR